MNNYQITSKAVIFDCGCLFNRNGKEVVFNPDLHDPKHTINFSCKETYRILSEGLTEGVFQLCSPLGKSWVKKVLPTEMEHISALGSVLRPGCLESKDSKGNSITVRYERKKNGKMPLSTYHPIVDTILAPTFGENIYQEQSIELAKQCAGFSLVEADLLRKGIGKKIPEIIAQCKKDFLSKGKELGIFTDEQLAEIFGWIEASQRYSFNHSLTANTSVFTKDGKKWINDVSIGEYILAPDKTFKKDKWVKITNLYKHGTQPVFGVTTASNHYIECTVEHKFLCTDNIVRRMKDIIGTHCLRLKNDRFDAIKCIKFLGYIETYDITVKNKHHLFYANGDIITSNSHAWSYGLNGYVTAYQKAHFPLQFYQSWLANEDKRENYVNFVNEAKLFNINIYPPDLRNFCSEFYVRKHNIYFGLHNIKGLVKKDVDSLTKLFAEKGWIFGELGKSISWLDFLVFGLESVSSKTAECLIHSGALDCFGIDRAKLYYEYERWCKLTGLEKKIYVSMPEKEELTLCYFINLLVIEAEEWYRDKLESYNKKVEKRKNSKRKTKKEPKPFVEPKEDRRLPKLREILKELTSPIYTIQDTVDSIIFSEESLLGVTLTRHKTDEVINAAETATCLDVIKGKNGYNVLRVKIEECRIWKCKNDTNMAFIKISDKTSVLPAIAFGDVYEEYQHLLTRGNIVFVSGEMGQKDSFLIKRAYSIS